ncbi:6652_t:CDS:2 [Paraglomus brasilianum]|uniref:6652_t:CDS:1 n=1 Tax=Paraglomus brasilianum TaxID=144538 RepID=A0A9N9FSE0_9GLOM|nr:6652_t:CDS:2 [Paraglomus brasilianum]
MSASGFYNAPITKALFFGIGGCSIAAVMLTNKSNSISQSIHQVVNHSEFLRLLTTYSGFSGTSELIGGWIILYHLRLIERQFGSAKYAAFLFASTALSTLFELGVSLLGRSFGFTYASTSPYALIFAGLYQYQQIIPDEHNSQSYGLSLNNKFIPNTAGLLLLLSKYPHSTISGICGLTAGAIYRSDMLKLSRWRSPEFLNRFASSFLLPIIGSSQPRRPSNSSSAMLDENTPGTSDTTRGSDSHEIPTTPPLTVNRDAIANLQAIFPDSDESTIIRALRDSDNDMNRAVQYLLDHS